MRIKLAVFLLTLILCVVPAQMSRSPGAAATHHANTAYQFIDIETTVHVAGVETSSEHPNERRWYISNIIVQPEDVPSYSLVKQKFMPYFSRNVMDPAEARGILIDYGEQDVKMNGDVSYVSYLTRKEAEDQRNEDIDYRKGQGGNIYSFEIDFNNPKGEETSKPKLIYRDKEQPNYEK